MQASVYLIGDVAGHRNKDDAGRDARVASASAWWPADVKGRQNRSKSPSASSVSQTLQSLVPVRSSAAARRASHCSGLTGVDGRPHIDYHDAASGRGVQVRRRTPTDCQGSETQRFSRASTASCGYANGRQRGVQFAGGSGDDSSGSSSYDDNAGGSRTGALELPALPNGGGINGGGRGGVAAAGLPGVTLAFLESLRAASRPGATLRELFRSMVLPATRASRCAYVNLLSGEQRARPTHVLVCSWDERVVDLVDLVADHASNLAQAQAAGQAQSSGQVAQVQGGGRQGLRRSVEQLCGDGGTSGGGTAAAAAASPPFAVWLDLFAVNFHTPAPPPAPAAAASGVFGAAARMAPASKPSTPSLDAASLERARALPAAIAATRSVLLLPGAQGAGLREHPCTLAAWHVLKGRGCAGGAALSVVAPLDVDLGLMQAAFEGLTVAAKAADDSGGGDGDPDGPFSSSGSHMSPDRIAVRAMRDGAAGGSAAAAATAAIYAADPLPSRTVREGLTAAAVATATTLLSQPVGHSGPAQMRSASPQLPSTPPPLSPPPLPHAVLQGRSCSVNCLESHAPHPPLSTSRVTLLPSPLRSGSAAVATAAAAVGVSSRSPLFIGEAWISSVGSPTAATAMAATGSSMPLLRAPSGRCMSFTAMPVGEPPGAAGDEEEEEGALSLAGRGGRTVVGMGGGPEGSHGGWMVSGASDIGAMDALAARRLQSLAPMLDASASVDVGSVGAGGTRLLQLRSRALAPWETSSPLPNPSGRTSAGLHHHGSSILSGPQAQPQLGGGSAGSSCGDEGTTAPSQPQLSALGSIAPMADDFPASASLPLPRLAPLQPATGPYSLTPAPLPLLVPFQDSHAAPAAAAAAVTAAASMPSPFRMGRPAAPGSRLPPCRFGGTQGHAPSSDALDVDDVDEYDSDPDADVPPPILMDTASSFLYHARNTPNGCGAPYPYPHPHTALFNGSGGGGGGQHHPSPPPPPPAAVAAAATEPRVPDSPPCPSSSVSYRPLAPDLARLVAAGRLLAALGQSSTALRLVRHAVSSARSLHGPLHTDTARCAAALGNLTHHCQQQQQQQAQQQQKPGGGGGGGGFTGTVPGSGVASPICLSAAPSRAALFNLASGDGAAGSLSGAAAPAAAAVSLALLRCAASPSRVRRSSSPAAAATAGLAGHGGTSSASVSPGSNEEVEGLLRGAAAVLERFLGPHNEEVLAARQGLAAVLAATGRHDEAISLLQRAVGARHGQRRPPSEVVLGSALDLAACLATTGRHREARKLLKAQLQRLQDDEDDAAAVAAATAMAAARGARSWGSSALSASTSNLPAAATSGLHAAPHPARSGPQLLLPYSTDGGGGGRGAGGLASASHSGCPSPGSPNGPQAAAAQRALTPLKREELLARCAHHLAQLKTAAGKTDPARTLYRRAIESYSAVYGSRHVITAGCMLALAALNHTVREYGEALELYRAVLETYLELYGPHHPATTRVSNRLGDVEEEIEGEEEVNEGRQGRDPADHDDGEEDAPISR